MKLEFSSQIFEKYSNIKFHENPFRGSEVFLCGREDGRTAGYTDTTKIRVAFRNVANAPNKRDFEVHMNVSISLTPWRVVRIMLTEFSPAQLFYSSRALDWILLPFKGPWILHIEFQNHNEGRLNKYVMAERHHAKGKAHPTIFSVQSKWVLWFET
jgi:hypothetical protein